MIRVLYNSTEKKQKIWTLKPVFPSILKKSKENGGRKEKEGPVTKERRKGRETKRQYE